MRKTLALLWALYFVEGLPFGFQTIALPIMLRERGVALGAIGFLSLLSLPWLAKPLLAPAIDGLGISRRAFILPLQTAMALTCVVAGLAGASTLWVCALVFAMNVLAAAQDIPIDGLAVDLLSERHLGAGNAAQVGGYKVGMLVGGSAFVWASAYLPWRTMFFVMGGLVLAVTCLTALLPVGRAARRTRIHVGAVVRELVQALAGNRTLIVFLLTYKLGEGIATSIWKLFLFDGGHGKQLIGQVSLVGMLASIAGSLAGGVLATRLPLVTALWLPAVARIVPMAAQALIALSWPGVEAVFAVTVLEHLTGGALTTVVFALMMSRVDKRIGASHYTALATIEVAGKYPGSWIAGLVAGTWGYPAVFAVATTITLVTLLAIPPLRQRAPIPA